MKANDAKNKFVYPDRLYARCKNNKTLDISYAPQTLEAVEYIRTDAFVGKALLFLVKHRNFISFSDTFIKDFESYMEGE